MSGSRENVRERKSSTNKMLDKKLSTSKFNVLSPSASSEAILPSENSDGGTKIKLSNMKKKSSNQKDGKKKQFKVTKKFKDDIPPKPPKK